MDYSFAFNDKTFLVTGASSGIGRNVSVYLSRIGAKVVLSGRNIDELENTRQLMDNSDEHFCEAFDLNCFEEINDWLKQVCGRVGMPLNGLVHCGGIHQVLPIRLLTHEDVEKVFKINVTSAFMLLKALAQRKCYVANDCSAILMSSASGLKAESGISVYSASKAAIISLTQSAAAEFATLGIRVNCIAAGVVRTKMSDELFSLMSEEQIAIIEKKHLLGIGETSDVASMCAYILSKNAKWITGSVFSVDGGYSLK